MKKLRRFAYGVTAGIGVMMATAVNSFAASVDLPPEFSEFVPIIEFILRIIETISKIFSLFN